MSISKALEKKKKLLANAHNQIDQLRAGMAMKRAEMGTDLIDQLTPEEKLQEEIRQLNEEFSQQENNIEARSAEVQDQESFISKCQGYFASLKIERDELQETRKKLWKQENQIASEIDKLKSEIVKAEKKFGPCCSW